MWHVDTEESLNWKLNKEGVQIWYFNKPEDFESIIKLSVQHHCNPNTKGSFVPNKEILSQVCNTFYFKYIEYYYLEPHFNL